METTPRRSESIHHFSLLITPGSAPQASDGVRPAGFIHCEVEYLVGPPFAAVAGAYLSAFVSVCLLRSDLSGLFLQITQNMPDWARASFSVIQQNPSVAGSS